MKEIIENCTNLSAGSVRALVAISMFKITVKIQDERQEITLYRTEKKSGAIARWLVIGQNPALAHFRRRGRTV
jgi:hypothetical protein